MHSQFRGGRSMDVEAIKRNAFRDQGILVVAIDDPRLAWPDRELLKQIGDKFYGRKQSGDGRPGQRRA